MVLILLSQVFHTELGHGQKLAEAGGRSAQWIYMWLCSFRMFENLKKWMWDTLCKLVLRHLVNVYFTDLQMQIQVLYISRMVALNHLLFVNFCQEESIQAVLSQRWNHPNLQLLPSLMWFDSGVESAWYSYC